MKRKITNREISFFGTVQDFFIKYLYQFQQYDLIQKCKIDCLKGKSIYSYLARLLTGGSKLCSTLKMLLQMVS